MKIVSFVLFLLKIFIEVSCLNCFISFLLSALKTAKHNQNIVLAYTLEVMCTHNQCFREEMKNKVYPSKFKLNYIKVEFKGCLICMGVLSSYSTISTWQLKLRCNNVNNVIYAPSHP